MIVGLYSYDFRIQPYRDVRFPAQLLHQVVRHAFFQCIAANNERHLSSVVREKQRSLPGRITCTDQVNVLPMSGIHFAARRTIVDALADQRIEPIDRQAAPRDTTGKNDGVCADHLVAIEKYLSRDRIDTRHRTGD